MPVLFSATGSLSPVDSKSHVAYSFYISEGYPELKIYFSYTPKILEDQEIARRQIEIGIDRYCGQAEKRQELLSWEKYLPLQNLLTLTVEDAEKFRGCAHRQNPDQCLLLSASAASPGMISGDNLPGLWTATVSIHTVVTDVCSYSLEVIGGRDDA